MCDLFLMIGGIVVVATFVCIGHYLERRGACRHSFSTWDVSETDYAYVQHRTCTKCGSRDITQYRKMTSGGEK